MEFFNTAYIFLAPILIALSFLFKNKKQYILNILAVANVLLIYHSIFIIRQFYAFAQLAKNLHIQPNTTQETTTGWNEIKLLLTILLPFLFLIKRISANRILSLLMLFLLINNWLYQLIISLQQNWSVGYTTSFYVYQLPQQIMHYISWLIFVYALFWLIKKLPYQQTKK